MTGAAGGVAGPGAEGLARLAQAGGAQPPALSPVPVPGPPGPGAEARAATPDVETLVDLLAELRQPEPPPPVPMTPQTPGWAVLGALVVLAAALALRSALRRHRANAWRREALAALAAAGDDPAAVAPILRRAALAIRPREEVAGLSGAAWLAFLDAAGGRPAFAGGPEGAALLRGPYDRGAAPLPGLGRHAADWVRRVPHAPAPAAARERQVSPAAERESSAPAAARRPPAPAAAQEAPASPRGVSAAPDGDAP